MRLLLSVLVAVLLLDTPSTALCRGDRQACYRGCASCRTRCHGDKQCKETCYELKRACCEMNGWGPGPRKDCTCT